MEFNYLEAQVKDVFPQASPKQILRQSKRIVRQLNGITDGALDTKTAITENVNGTYTLTFAVVDAVYTISDTGTGGTLFANLAVGDMLIISGTALNDGVYTTKEIVDDDSAIVTEVIVAEVAIECTAIVCTVDSTFSLSYNTPGVNIMLTLPDSFNKLAPGGVVVANEVWDQRTIDYILRNPSEEAYNINERDEIVFGGTAFLTDVDVLIRGYFDFVVPTSAASDAVIAIPDAWIEGFMAGVLGRLAMLRELGDKDFRRDIQSENSAVYQNMITQIMKQETGRFTMETTEQSYNYNDPSK